MNKGVDKEKELEAKKKAFDIALDVRKFEIELYWKRTTYFWTLVTAIFVGYFVTLRTAPNDYKLAVLLSSIGLVLSLGWYLANRGSKYWQQNWEKHVVEYGKVFADSVFENLRDKKDDRWWHLHKGYRYSVSKINQLISLYVVSLWVVFFISSVAKMLSEICGRDQSIGNYLIELIVTAFTVCAVAGLLFLGRGNWKKTS